MKKLDKNKFKKQLVSGGIYIALAAAVVTVTLSSVNKIVGDNEDYEIPEVDLNLPKIDNDTNPFITDINSNDNPFDIDENDETLVSGKAEGVSDEMSENDIEKYIGPGSSESVNTLVDNTQTSGEPEDVEYPTEPEISYYGVYAKPADGYIDREFSLDELLYSPTMGDYRTHNGVDITGDLGSAVRSIGEGVIEDVYYDDFYGYTVAINHGDGIVAYYMNLSESFPSGIEKGVKVATGQTIGGIGNSAMIESADVSHLHFSIKKNGDYIDPGEFLRG